MSPVKSNLVPFCPALPKLLMNNGLHTVAGNTLVPTALELLENNQAIVISGSNHYNYRRNRQIGKTTIVNRRLIPRLMNQGRTVSYFNIQSAVYNFNRFSNGLEFDYSLLPTVFRALPYTDVMVLDESQHAMISSSELKFRRAHRLSYKGPILKLWNKMERNLARGGKIVFISCCHPFDDAYDDCLLNSAMALFFCSPVLELKSPE